MLIEIDNTLADSTDISSAVEKLDVEKNAPVRVSTAIRIPIKIPSALSTSRSMLGILDFLDAINFR